jgi:hypothetical protein
MNVDIQDTSPEFEAFLNFLGSRIELQGWTGYRGDLDVKGIALGESVLFGLFDHILTSD